MLQNKENMVAMDQVALTNQLNTILAPTSKESTAMPSMFGALTQLSDSTADQVPKPPQSKLFAKILNTAESTIEDPLRELVLSSKHTTDPNALREIANRAANLQNVEEVPLRPATTVKSIAGIFTGTDTFVKKVEETIKKKYAALEPSDSEGYGEAPLLGRVSRTRRAKSANQRSSAKPKAADKKRLIRGSESSSLETVNHLEAENSDLEYAADRINQVKESIIADPDNVSGCNLRPVFLDVTSGKDDV